MSNLEHAVRQICKTTFTKELILENNSNILAYSILSGKPLEEIRHIDPNTELTDSQLDDFHAIRVIISKIKYDLQDFDFI